MIWTWTNRNTPDPITTKKQRVMGLKRALEKIVLNYFDEQISIASAATL